MRRITVRLEKIGYLTERKTIKQVMLIELKLPDIPGSVTPVLEKINRYNVNISYLNSQANGTAYQSQPEQEIEFIKTQTMKENGITM